MTDLKNRPTAYGNVQALTNPVIPLREAGKSRHGGN
jgi:hypothetical protein